MSESVSESISDSVRNALRNLETEDQADTKPAGLIEMVGVDRRYETPVGPLYALRAANLSIATAQFVAIVGPSGSGKSTLLNIVCGVDRPTAGDVVIAGVPLASLSTSALARWRSAHCGVILQSQQLIPTLTAQENVTLAMDLGRTIDKPDRAPRAEQLLDQVGLADLAHRFPDELSGGQQQRVAVARSLANRPAVIVADEPTAALDSVTAKAIYELLAGIADENQTTIVCSTHDEWLAGQADRVVRVHDGILQP